MIKEVGPLKLMGLLYEGKNENQEIAGLWGDFIGRSAEVKAL